MSLIDIVLLAIALGIDCLVVSFSQGLIFNAQRVKYSLLLALIMGVFQGCMPIIGYVGTDYLYNLIVPFSKWIVFAIFLALGLELEDEFWTNPACEWTTVKAWNAQDAPKDQSINF